MPTKINKDQKFNVEIVKISVYCLLCNGNVKLPSVVTIFEVVQDIYCNVLVKSAMKYIYWDKAFLFLIN